MRLKPIKLVILFLAGVILAACAGKDELKLPDPIASSDSSSGWRNY